MIKQVLTIIFGCFLFASGYSQIGGSQVFSFLSLSSSARLSALGGGLISVVDDDISLAYENPALLNQSMDQSLSFQHQFLFSGIQHGYASFGKWIEKPKIMSHIGFNYIMYGQFDETDEFGNLLGSFSGNEVAINLGGSYDVYEKLRVGANLKWISSSLETYRASGLAWDLGAVYQDTSSRVALAFVIKNAGFQIAKYNNEPGQNLPLNVQIGLSKRLRYLPFRFSVVFHHLNRWNLLYDDPENEEGGFLTGFEVPDNNSSGFDNFFRHVIFNGELLLGANDLFRIRIGYNHQRKQELSVRNINSLAGFSFGIGFRVKKIRFDYGLSKVHFAGSTHHLGISTNLKYFTKPGILN